MASLPNQGARLEERVFWESHALLNSSILPHSFFGPLPASVLGFEEVLSWACRRTSSHQIPHFNYFSDSNHNVLFALWSEL